MLPFLCAIHRVLKLKINLTYVAHVNDSCLNYTVQLPDPVGDIGDIARHVAFAAAGADFEGRQDKLFTDFMSVALKE